MNEIGVHSRSVFIFAGLLLRSGAPSCFSLMPSRVACGVGRLSAPALGGWSRRGGLGGRVRRVGFVLGYRCLRLGAAAPGAALRCGVFCWGWALPSGGVRCGPAFCAGAGGSSRRGGLWGRGRWVGFVLGWRRLRLGAAAPGGASARRVLLGSGLAVGWRAVWAGLLRRRWGGGPGGAALGVACAGLASIWGVVACGWVRRLRGPLRRRVLLGSGPAVGWRAVWLA